MTVPVALAGVSGILSVSGISRKRCKTSPSSSLTLKASFVQPLSLAFARQLPWQGSPWQRGSVFDETDWGLLENVTECQSLSLWERWHCEAIDGEGKDADKKQKNTAIQALFVRDIVSQRRWSNFTGLALSGAGAPALPKGEPLAKRFRFR